MAYLKIDQHSVLKKLWSSKSYIIYKVVGVYNCIIQLSLSNLVRMLSETLVLNLMISSLYFNIGILYLSYLNELIKYSSIHFFQAYSVDMPSSNDLDFPTYNFLLSFFFFLKKNQLILGQRNNFVLEPNIVDAGSDQCMVL